MLTKRKTRARKAYAYRMPLSFKTLVTFFFSRVTTVSVLKQFSSEITRFFPRHWQMSDANIQTSAAETFNHTICLLVANFYNKYLFLPRNEEERLAELLGFIENYNFPRVGAWNGFHVYASTKLKSYFSFKKRYNMSNLALVAFNKRILYAAAYCMLLNDAGKISLGNVLDSAFPHHPSLLKGCNKDTQDRQQKYFPKKLCSTRVVTENAYGMLGGNGGYSTKRPSA